MVPESTFFNPKKHHSREGEGRRQTEAAVRRSTVVAVVLKQYENIVVLVDLHIGGETTQSGTGLQ